MGDGTIWTDRHGNLLYYRLYTANKLFVALTHEHVFEKRIILSRGSKEKCQPLAPVWRPPVHLWPAGLQLVVEIWTAAR